jgi:phytoene dehydrogenase-like protein
MLQARNAVVIGAGVGGMCAGALLATRGYRVVVCERLDTVGGRSRTQWVGGYGLPRGAVSFQLTGALPKLCAEVGAEFEVRPVSEMWFWIKGGSEFTPLPAKGGVKKMLEMFAQVHGGNKSGAVAQVGLQLAMSRIGAAFRSSEPIPEGEEGPSFRDWLRQHTDNEELISLFHTITSAVSAVNDFEYPARHWFAHFSQKGLEARVDQYGLVAGGFVAVSRALGAVIERQGGEVRLNTSVRRIVTAAGRATGVEIETEGGIRTLPADLVISNAGPTATLGLADEGAFDPEFVAFTRRRVRPTPIVLTFTVSDVPLFPHRASILAAGLQRVVTAVPLTNICPEWAPDGKHITAFYGTPKSCLTPMDRDDERRRNTEDVHTLFPNLTAAGGRILDVQLRDVDDPDVVARSWPGYNVPVTTSLPNVFNVGDACGPDGFVATPAAAMSARLAVDRITAGAAD